MTLSIKPTAQAIAEAAGEDLSRYYEGVGTNQLVADPSRREAVSYDSDSDRVAAHLYRPPGAGAGERTAAVVMTGPISSVKEQTVPHYAERLADAGYTVLTFDPRSFGESTGEPRFHYVPERVIADYCNGVGYLLGRDDIDPDRIATVGVCMGGGFAVSAAARDRRVAACASVAGGYDVGATMQMFMGVEGFAAYVRTINDLHQRQRETGEVAYIPSLSAEGLTDEVPVAAMPNPEATAYYERTSRDHAPNWSHTITAASLETFFAYNGLSHARLLAPTPLLIVHGTRDFFLLPEFAQQAYDAATGPKELVWIETHNHIELYDQDPYVSQAAEAVAAFLDTHLGARTTAAAA